MKFIFPTDEHHPFVDHRAVDLALKIAEDFRPDLRVAGSDGVDFYTLSKFDKNPDRVKAGGIQEELNSWRATQLKWIDATPDAEVQFLIGNHEIRMRRYLWRHDELFGLRALEYENLFMFAELGIEMAERGGREINLFNRLLITHGSVVRKFSAYTARAEVENERYQISTLTGHTHRGGKFYTRTRTGVVQGVEGFCLCRLDPEYVNHPDWQQGLVVGEVSNNHLEIEDILFQREYGKIVARWRGKEYKA